MTDIEKIRIIAEQVMGWTLFDADEYPLDCWVNKVNGSVTDVTDFDPLHNVAQAVDAIECWRLSWKPTFALVEGEYRLMGSGSCSWELNSPAAQIVEQAQWQALIYADDQYCAYADTPAAAICDALLLAVQSNEDGKHEREA